MEQPPQPRDPRLYYPSEPAAWTLYNRGASAPSEPPRRYFGLPPNEFIMSMVGVVLLAIAFCIGLSAITNAMNPRTTVYVYPTATSVMTPALPTQTPIASRVLTGRVFGGSPSAFPTSVSIGSASGALRAFPRTGADGSPHVVFFDLSKDSFDAGWEAAAANAYMRAFLPPDAQFTHDTTLRDGTADHHYTSALLAATFGTSGKFDWFCNRVFAPSGVDACEMSLPYGETPS